MDSKPILYHTKVVLLVAWCKHIKQKNTLTHSQVMSLTHSHQHGLKLMFRGGGGSVHSKSNRLLPIRKAANSSHGYTRICPNRGTN